VSPLFWLLACAYLIVAATSLHEAELRPARSARPAVAALCLSALGFAAAWPIRAARSALRHLHRLR
jgi:hypothetical protein